MERSEPFGDDGADERGDEPTDPHRVPLPPPELRAWRHPSELTGDQPTFAHHSHPRLAAGSRLPVALLAGAASALAIAALLGAMLPLAGRHRATVEEASAALGFSTSTIRVVASLAVSSTEPPAVPTGVVELVAVTRSGERRAYATVVDGALVTTAAAVEGATALYVEGAHDRRIDATVVEVSREGVAVLSTGTMVAAPAALGGAADLDTGDTVMVMTDGKLRASALTTVGETTETVTGATLSFLLRADIDSETAEGAPLLDRHGVVIGLCTHDADGDVVVIPIELAAARASGVGAGTPTGVTWLGLAGRNDVDGVLVTEVTAAGPAALGDLAVGDRVTAVNGRATKSVTQLVLRLRAHRPHEHVTFTVVRGAEVLQRSVELGSDRKN